MSTSEGLKKEATELLEKIIPEIFDAHSLEFRPFFGAITVYVDGALFMSYGKFGVALKLPPETLENLFSTEQGAPFRYFPKGHVKKEYALLSSATINSTASFRKLIQESLKLLT